MPHSTGSPHYHRLGEGGAGCQSYDQGLVGRCSHTCSERGQPRGVQRRPWDIPAVNSTLWAVGCQLRMPTLLEWPSSFTTGSLSGEVRPPSGISQICWRATGKVLAISTMLTTVCMQISCSACPSAPRPSPWRCSPLSRWQWCCHCEGTTQCPGPALCDRTRLGRTCRYGPSGEGEGGGGGCGYCVLR